MNNAMLRMLSIVATLAVAAVGNARAADVAQLTLANWEDWTSERVIRTFEQKEGVKVNLVTYTSAEESLQRLQEMDGQIDILVGNPVVFDKLRTAGKLGRLDTAKVANLKHMVPGFRVDPNYAVPYMWGYTGIAVRSDLVKTPIKTYAQLLEFAKRNPGKVSLLTDPLENSYALLWGLGPKNPDPESVAQLKEAREKFDREYADKIRLVDNDYEDDSPMASGKVIVSQIYSDYATYLVKDRKLALTYVNPDDVCIVWLESMMLMANAPQPELALRFMNYVSDAKVSARNAMDVQSSSPNAMAASYYTKEFLNNPVVNPRFQGAARCETYRIHQPPAQEHFRNLAPKGLPAK